MDIKETYNEILNLHKKINELHKELKNKEANELYLKASKIKTEIVKELNRGYYQYSEDIILYGNEDGYITELKKHGHKGDV